MDTTPMLMPIPADSKVTSINDCCCIRDLERMRTVLVRGLPMFYYDLDDKVSERNAVVTLVNNGWAMQQEIAATLGVGTSTVRQWQRRYDAMGIRGLERKKRRSPLLKMGGARDKIVRRLFEEGRSNYFIARQIGVSEYAVRYALKRMGLKREKPRNTVPDLGLVSEDGTVLSAPSEPVGEIEVVAAEPTDCTAVAASAGSADEAAVAVDVVEEVSPGAEDAASTDEGVRSVPGLEAAQQAEGGASPVAVDPTLSLDTDPSNRSKDRMMACLGLLEDAAPLFRNGRGVRGAGVLLAIPLIVSSGALETFRRTYGSLGPAFYGLRTTVVSFFVMALLRIGRVEGLKQRPQVPLGRTIGLDRFPEAKTLRRKLTMLAERKRARVLMREMARRRMKERRDQIGFLYADGHTREYHGKGKLAKAYVTRRRLAAKGATDTWVNDAGGEPLFLVTCDLNANLSRMLEPVLDEVEELLGGKRRLTMVFDRGGWDRKLFARLIERGYDILTYRKGRCEELPVEAFAEQEAKIEGKRYSYLLHETSVRLGDVKVRGADGAERPLWMRQVTRLKEDGRQTQVLTTRGDLGAVEVLWRMFNRWRQENFFKYMRTEYLLDALPDYNLESVDGKLDRPNPERTALEKQIKKTRRELRTLEAGLGKTAAEGKAPWWRSLAGFQNSNAELVGKIEEKRKQIDALALRRDQLPKRVPASDLQRQARERKLIVDTVKMTAYQIETRLLDMVRDHYARTDDEGRKLIVSALTGDADLKVSPGRLRVTLAAQSSPHRSRAVAALCEQLNALDVCFPGTDLRLRYRVAGVRPG